MCDTNIQTLARRFGTVLIAAVALSLALSSPTWAWTHDSGNKDNEWEGAWSGCCNWRDFASASYTGRSSNWTQSNWQFRGRFRAEVDLDGCCYKDHGGNCPYYLQQSGGGTVHTPWLNQCTNNGGWRGLSEENWNGDSQKFWRLRITSWDCSYPNCSSWNEAGAGAARLWGEKWDYINDWVCLGGYSGTKDDNATGWTESDMYLYPAVDTSHGNVFRYGGKTPGRVQTGDCNHANKLDWKGNAASYGNCDNCYSYGFAWMYAPSGAGPRFLVGGDDDVKVWVNGSLIVNGTNCCERDRHETGGFGMPAGWSRILFKVRNGGGGFNGTVSLRNGGTRAWNEGSVTRYSSSYGLGYEQNDWYPRIDVANFNGTSNPQPNSDYYSNNTTVTASGTASGSGPVPLWKVMQYQWGYNISETNFIDVSSSGSNWSNTQTGVTGHRRFHFFAVSKSKRTSGQKSGSSGGWTYEDGGAANYMDMYVDDLPPLDPKFSSVTAASTSAMTLNFALPNDQGYGVSAGSTEASAEASATGNNYYRRGDVGVKVYADGSMIRDFGGAGPVSHTGLSPNTQYTYTLQARDNTGGGRGAWNNTTGIAGETAKYTWMEAPTGLSFGAVTPNSIVVNANGSFTNLTVGSSGVRITNDTAGSGNNSGWKNTVADVAAGYTSGSLKGNVLYTFRTESRNADSVTNTDSQPTATKYTLAPRPSIGNNVTCDKATSNVWYGPGTTFTFSNPAGWGANLHSDTSAHKVKKFTYVWNTDSSYTWGGSKEGTDWSSGTIVTSPLVSGTTGTGHYLHLQSYNQDDLPTPAGTSPMGTLSYGPFQYDDTPATVSAFSNPSRSATNSSTSVSYTLTFSEAITGLDTSGIQVTTTGGAAATVASVVTNGNPTTYGSWTGYASWIVTLSNCTGNGTACIAVKANAATDRAGNYNTASGNSNTFVVDNIRPTVTSITRLNPLAEATHLSIVYFQVVFSEPVSGLTPANLALNLQSGQFTNGAITNISPSSGDTFTVTVGNIVSSGGGYLSISVPENAAADPAGNNNEPRLNTYDTCAGGGTDCRYLIDQGELTCAITGPPPAPQTVTGPSVTYNFAFNKATTSFNFSKIHCVKSAGISSATFSAVNFEQTDQTYKNYSFTVTDIVGTGTISVSLVAGEFTDEFGNSNSAAGPSTYQVDGGNPACVITRGNPTTASTNLDTVVYTITFGWPVWGFTTNDIALSGTAPGKTKGTLTGADGDSVYTIAVTNITGSGTVIISVPADAAFDNEGAGNGNTPGTALTYTIDMTPPTVSSSVRYNPATWYTNASTVVYRVTFPEAVTGVDTSDLSVAVTTGSIQGASITSVAPAAAPADGTKVYDVTVDTGTGNGDLLLQVGPNATINDLVGNPIGSGYVYAGGQTYRLDRDNPAVTSITRLNPSGQYTNASSAVFRVTFGKPVLHVDATDFTLTHVSGTITGTSITSVTAVGGTQPAEQFDVAVNTGTGNGDLRLDIPLNPANPDPITDEAENGLAAAYSTGQVYSVNRDTLECVVTRTQPSPNNAASVGYRIEFQGGGLVRAVSGFTVDEIQLHSTVSGATLGALTTSGNAYLINVTNMAIESSGQVYISVPANAAQDIYGNLSTANDCGGTGDIPYVIDRQLLSCTINQLSDNPTNGTSVQYQIGFNKVVSGFEFSDLDTTGTTAPGTTWGALTSSANPGDVNRIFYIAASGISGSGEVSLTIPQNVAQDTASNGNSQCGPSIYAVNQTRPSCTVARTGAYRTAAEDVTFSVTFSTAVTGFAANDLVLNASGFSPQPTLELTGTGASYTVFVSGIHGSGILGLAVRDEAAQDAVGNKTTAGTEATYEIDQQAMTVTVEQSGSQPDPTAVLPIEFEINFSKSIASGTFTSADVSFGGTASVTEFLLIPVSQQVFRIQVNAALPGTIVPTVAAGVTADTLGNLNEASTSTDNSVTYAPGDMPQVANWYSTRDHGVGQTVTPVRLPMTSAGAPKVESRDGGVQLLEVLFTEEVEPKDGTIDSNEIVVTGTDYLPLPPEQAPTITMTDARTLQLSFPTPLLSGEYHLEIVADAWRQVAPPNFDLAGDNATCTVLVRAGDSNQDNQNTLLDVAAIRAHNRVAVDSNTAQHDLNADGQINLIDMALARSRSGQQQ